MLTDEKIGANIRLWHALTENWRNHVADVEIELFGTVPDAVFSAHCRKAAIEQNPNLWAKLNEVTTDLNVQKYELEVRMVEAHEWMRGLREGATQS